MDANSSIKITGEKNFLFLVEKINLNASLYSSECIQTKMT